MRLIVTDPYPTDEGIFVQMVDYINVIIQEDLGSSTSELGLISPLKISPNPASQFINIKMEWDDYESSLFTITDIKGKKVIELEIQGKLINTNIDIKELPTGNYFLEVNNGRQKIKDQFIVIE